MRFAVGAIIAVVAGCGPQPLGTPCPPAVETASPTIAPAASGGAFVFGSEGLPSGTFVRRFDAAGALAWTVALPALPGYEDRTYAVAGDTVFAVVEHTIGYTVSGVRDGALAFSADVPYDCRVQAFEAEGDRLRVYGRDHDERSCSFRVAPDGTFDDALVFDEGVYSLRAAPSGGFVAVATDGVVRYDGAANRLWAHAGAFADALEAGGAVLALADGAAPTTLVRIGSDGQGQEPVAPFAQQLGSSSGPAELVPLATSDGAVFVVGDGGAIVVVRVVAASVAWSHTITSASFFGAALGSGMLVVRGSDLVAFDLDGNIRFTAPAPLDATIGSDDIVRTADVKALDACRQVLRVSTLDGSGQVQASWSAR